MVRGFTWKKAQAWAVVKSSLSSRHTEQWRGQNR